MLEQFDLLDQFSRTLVKQQVDIIEFAESDEYCGMQMYPRQRVLLKLMFLQELDGYDEDVLNEWIESTNSGGEVTIVPNIRERVEYLRENDYPHFNTIQLVGGRRSGKGHMTAAAALYKVWNVIQLDNPAQYYGLPQGKDMYVGVVADSQEQAKRFQYSDLQNWIEHCKPLVDEGLLGPVLAETISIYSPNDRERYEALRRKGVQVDKKASIVVAALPKNAGTVRGSASIVLIFDEMAHWRPGESKISDNQVFEAAEPSIRQFQKDAFLFANSSPYSKTGKFYELFGDAIKMDGDRPVFMNHLMIQMPSWEMYKDWEKDRRFHRAIVVDPVYDEILANAEKANPESFKVEYRGQFAEVLDAFLNPDRVDEMFDPRLHHELLGRRLRTQHGPANPFIAFKGHADPSSTTANFGIAIGHVEEIQEERTNAQGESYTVNIPHVIFDFINAFRPEDFENHTIDWLEVIPVLKDLLNRFRPYEFTFDQFESDAPMQILSKSLQDMGIPEVQIFEVTATAPKNKRRALDFKAALNLGRVHAPNPVGDDNERMLALGRDELKFLVDKNGRIEKQDIGPVRTKDIADCIMEVTHALVGDYLQNELAGGDMQLGGQGGYSIGGVMSGSGSDAFSEFYSSYTPGRGDASIDRLRGRRTPKR